jgi:hypothetical protein
MAAEITGVIFFVGLIIFCFVGIVHDRDSRLQQRCMSGTQEVFVEQDDGTAAWYPVAGAPECGQVEKEE